MRNHTEAERQIWHQTKALGRTRFVWRRVIGSFLFGWLLISFIDFFLLRRRPFSDQLFYIDVIMITVFLLEGYLVGGWKWKELEKKYPE